MRDTAEPTGPRLHSGLVMFAAICGLLTFVGVLVFGPSGHPLGDRTPSISENGAQRLIVDGQYETLAEQAAAVMDDPNPPLQVLMYYAWSLERLGRDDEAAAAWKRLKRVSAYYLDRPSVSTLLMAGWGEKRAGDPDKARVYFLRAAEAAMPSDEPVDTRRSLWESDYNVACALGLAGQPDRALGHLAAAMRRRWRLYDNIRWARVDPDLVASGLHEDPRFWAILAEAEARAREQARAEAQARAHAEAEAKAKAEAEKATPQTDNSPDNSPDDDPHEGPHDILPGGARPGTPPAPSTPPGQGTEPEPAEPEPSAP